MTIKLSTGREWDPGGAGNDVIGISADLQVTVGFDHGNEQWDDTWEYYDDALPGVEPPLTPQEKADVCDAVVARWQALKQRLLSG